jgi:hypothetical protein
MIRSAALMGLLACSAAQAFDSNLRYAFVTSTSGSGDLQSWGVDAGSNTGLNAADAICQARAGFGGLPQPDQFIAWMSDDSDDAYCRIHGLHGQRATNCGFLPNLPSGAGPWWRVDGVPFADTATQAFDYLHVLRTLDIDEFNHVSSALRTYTASYGSGDLYPFTGTCQNWQSTSGNTLSGLLNATGGAWSGGFFQDCVGPRALYCLQKGNAAPLPLGWHRGRAAFVSATAPTGNFGANAFANGAVGPAAADEICRHDANAYGLPRPTTYRAWISAPGVPASSRFQNNGPWYRTDGVLVASTLAQMQTAGLEQPINRILTAGEPYLGSIGIWTGTLTNSTPAPETCVAWTSALPTDSGSTGTADFRDTPWTDTNEPTNCAQTHPVYCLADNDTVFAHNFER